MKETHCKAMCKSVSIHLRQQHYIVVKDTDSCLLVCKGKALVRYTPRECHLQWRGKAIGLGDRSQVPCGVAKKKRKKRKEKKISVCHMFNFSRNKLKFKKKGLALPMNSILRDRSSVSFVVTIIISCIITVFLFFTLISALNISSFLISLVLL